eukprot:6183175-Pleurochrysis_carterae.AAC.1
MASLIASKGRIQHATPIGGENGCHRHHNPYPLSSVYDEQLQKAINSSCSATPWMFKINASHSESTVPITDKRASASGRATHRFDVRCRPREHSARAASLTTEEETIRQMLGAHRLTL